MKKISNLEMWSRLLPAYYNLDKLVGGLSELFQSIGVRKIHDAACGDGRIPIELVKKGFKVTCSDASSKSLDMLLYNCYNNGILPIYVRSYHKDIDTHSLDKISQNPFLNKEKVPTPEWHQRKDKLNLELAKKFGLSCCLTNNIDGTRSYFALYSFQHFLHECERKRRKKKEPPRNLDSSDYCNKVINTFDIVINFLENLSKSARSSEDSYYNKPSPEIPLKFPQSEIPFRYMFYTDADWRTLFDQLTLYDKISSFERYMPVRDGYGNKSYRIVRDPPINFIDCDFEEGRAVLMIKGNSLIYCNTWEKNDNSYSKGLRGFEREFERAIENFYKVLKPGDYLYIDITRDNEKPGTHWFRKGTTLYRWTTQYQPRRDIRKVTIDELGVRGSYRSELCGFNIRANQLIKQLREVGFKTEKIKVKGENHYDVILARK